MAVYLIITKEVLITINTSENHKNYLYLSSRYAYSRQTTSILKPSQNSLFVQAQARTLNVPVPTPTYLMEIDNFLKTFKICGTGRSGRRFLMFSAVCFSGL